MNRSIILPALVTAFVALSPAGVALADNPHDHGNIGQPDQEADISATDPGATSPPGVSTGLGASGGEPVRRRRLPVVHAPLFLPPCVSNALRPTRSASRGAFEGARHEGPGRHETFATARLPSRIW